MINTDYSTRKSTNQGKRQTLTYRAARAVKYGQA